MTHNEEDDEIFDEQVRQFMIRKGWDKLSKEELEKEVAILKKDSHPPIEDLEERLNKLEKEK